MSTTAGTAPEYSSSTSDPLWQSTELSITWYPLAVHVPVCTVPSNSMTSPAAQLSTQNDCPIVNVVLPVGHAVQAVCPGVEYVPAVQGVQLVWPVVLENLPASHGTHTPVSGMYDPSGHALPLMHFVRQMQLYSLVHGLPACGLKYTTSSLEYLLEHPVGYEYVSLISTLSSSWSALDALWHSSKDVIEWYLSDSHVPEATDLAYSASRPVAHRLHGFPSSDHMPAGQSSQLVWPCSEGEVPAAHGLQLN